jgi:two-component system LytT family response regulator
VVDESLAALERRLAPLGFVRVHRAELVQLGRIAALHHEPGALEAELDDGDCVPVSRRLAAELKRRLGLDAS